MTLEKKLNFVHNWNKELALNCWVTFHDKYQKKHPNAMFTAMVHGYHKKYIELECETFKRYAQMWHYRNVTKYKHMDD